MRHLHHLSFQLSTRPLVICLRAHMAAMRCELSDATDITSALVTVATSVVDVRRDRQLPSQISQLPLLCRHLILSYIYLSFYLLSISREGRGRYVGMKVGGSRGQAGGDRLAGKQGGRKRAGAPLQLRLTWRGVAVRNPIPPDLRVAVGPGESAEKVLHLAITQARSYI